MQLKLELELENYKIILTVSAYSNNLAIKSMWM